ncbi:unnamed protein product [Adineta steineri]|uniref:BBSome complex member BBS5 PH domain-containing protein n=2 Tax=Adineta steineri TaxID=433720 RepID=A0A815G3I5_9BILA|nr:unnamed protein product [Adineta steineri]CAF1051849.1 unnamed protein product [Adineta steineri]CAF1058843.1 unnamed protein product [Adineta steineri]CAF1232528.1 unnamed protein product [Adineta steineri]CAF1251323.1 unnamed protein product [Adineta steineri]
MAAAAQEANMAVWHDREIRFDVHPNDIKCRSGEFIIDTLSSVEDTKGNNGDKGKLTITNIRLIWHSHASARINLSIGLYCIVTITVRNAKSKLRGSTESLYLLTKSGSSRYEFIFTNLVAGSSAMLNSVVAVHKAYDSTRLYREIRLRSSLLNKGQLRLLPKERLHNRYNGVWNLSSDQGNLGIFHITDVRLIWHAELNENFNVSVPYYQTKTIKIRDSKFGLALVVETTPYSGNYLLGFQIAPEEKLREVHKEITTLHKSYFANPEFGVEFSIEDQQSDQPATRLESKVDDIEILQSREHTDSYATYLTDAGKRDRDPVYSDELGLAIEKLPQGYTLSSLWDILS